MTNKVVKICIFIFFIISLFSSIFSSMYVFKIRENKNNLEKEINFFVKKKNVILNENEKTKTDIESKRVELKDKIEEENIWKKMEEKIKKAL